jgi:PhoPQ-activated pathogenicity-related protein
MRLKGNRNIRRTVWLIPLNMNLRLSITLLLSFAAVGCTHTRKTALDRYVAEPDPNYEWRLVQTLSGDGYKAFVLEMTSQSWLTPEEVDRTLWKHWMTVIRPDRVRHETGLLFIGGSSNERPAPKEADANLVGVALATESVVTELRMVPNQPLTFAGETQPRVEDELIAYTWDKYLRTGDERWPARLPMTKSAVRAMDTITAFCAGPEAGGLRVGSFVVAGGSKRGWTTWTTAAVDERVVGIVPIVIDMLNVVPSFMHHWEAYGYYAPAVGDYEVMGIMDWQGTRQYRNLMKIEEPYEYRDRFTMPKLVLNATGDQFFLPDSSRFYFDDLPAPKYLRYVPNADHSLRETDAFETLAGFYHAQLNGVPMPRLDWKVAGDGMVQVETPDRPASVKLWQATNTTTRDFRVDTIGKAWTSTELSGQGEGPFVVRVEPPAQGWTAFLVEATFEYPDRPAPIKLTTPVWVIPDVTPFKFQPSRVRR